MAVDMDRVTAFADLLARPTRPVSVGADGARRAAALLAYAEFGYRVTADALIPRLAADGLARPAVTDASS
ncbi:hypothetical protein PHK61_00730 [Actinomycetospora lutea]|uniref:hypothetical protein n=1 Tax=Actinomycetospora lutea TaxID=663604 RepID=UPI00236673DF|nr:hypothetical protein [Actinomycetospora lutea]MDD7936939.1 hypothetical protein [Actinomycetospora lutea]